MIPDAMDLIGVVLRRPRGSDAEAIHADGNDPEVARYADWPLGTTVDRILESIRGRSARWERGEEFYCVVTIPGDGLAIGGISCRVTEGATDIGFFAGPEPLGPGNRNEGLPCGRRVGSVGSGCVNAREQRQNEL